MGSSRLRLGFLVLAVIAAAGCTTGGDPPPGRDGGFGFDSGPPGDGGGPDSPFPDASVESCTPEGMGSTIGQPCTDTAECDDGCYCNGVELCAAGTCAAGSDPCVDAVDCTTEACLEETNTCFHQPDHSMCADADACNGYEVCDPALGCRAGPPLYCNDESSCTVDSCDTTEGCVYTLRDLDADGFVDGRCGGDDCDDDPRFGRMIFPGATEQCTNRRDDDCDGLRDYNDPTCVPTNDTCATAQVIPGAGTYSGSTATLGANYTFACGGPSGPDAVFRFTLTEMQDVRVSVGGGGSSVAVALRPWAQCATGPEEKCSSSSPPSLLRRSLPPGEYAIIVKTSAGAPFDLSVMFAPPTPIPPVDVCNASTMDISGGGTFSGMFTETEDDYQLSCHASTGYRDAAYRFTITSPKDVTITASTSGSAWTPSTYLSLLTNCSSAASTVSCMSGTTATLRRRSLPAGTYYVLLESSATDATAWTMNVTITDPMPRAPGDACTSAIDITSASGSASLSTAELDVGTSCGGTTSSYRDVMFSFTLPTTRDVTLTTQAPGFHYAAVETTCGTIGSEIRCRSGGTSTTPLVQSWRSMPAGTYYVVVSTLSASGNVTATVTTSAPTPIPPNDVCSGAIEIGSGYSSRDTLTDFDDDVTGCSGTGRPDAFYRLTLAAPRRVSIFAARPSGSTGQIYLTLRDSCSSTTNIACNNGDPSAAMVQTLAAGTYYLIVETLTTTAGDYTLDVFVSAP